MSALARRLRVVSHTPKPKARKPGTWGPLSAPVDPLDTFLRSRAQSVLTGFHFRDGSSVAPFLPIEQARDVIAWHSPERVTP